jgi:predicted  nucleic acid-binding Zn-ribbon protein
MAIRPEANVDPNAIKAMHQKVRQIREEIEGVSRQMKQGIDTLYNSGHRDQKFDELRGRVDESEDDMKSLMRFMDSYTNYLQQQEKIIREYLNTKSL